MLPFFAFSAGPASASGALPFTTLAPGFTQSLYATGLQFAGGVAFAPNGDPIVAFFSLQRIDSTSTITQNGSTIHPTSSLGGSVGLGLANSADGGVYANLAGQGVVKIDPTTGNVLAGPYGAAGNELGIALDPQTHNLVYAGSDGKFYWVSPDFTSQGVFSTQAIGADGIAFDPTGNYLFTSTSGALAVLDRHNNLVQTIPLANSGCCTDGIAFHASEPKFVISNNTDGTITRYDFPSNDFTQTPTQALLASGGFRGDMLQVAGDGCAYLVQAQTRFDDGTVSNAGSLVKLCPGFAPAVPDTDLAITNVPSNQTINATGPTGAVATFTLPTATDEDATAPTVACDHASGSTFAIGTTTVTCTATDADDNPTTATRTFTVTVKGAAAQLADLLAFDGSLPPGHAFRDKTQAAINYLASNDIADTCSELQGIIALANAQSGKAITTSQANTIIASASRIRLVLGC